MGGTGDRNIKIGANAPLAKNTMKYDRIAFAAKHRSEPVDAIKEAMIRAEDRGDNEEDAAFVRAALQGDIDALEDRMLTLEWRLGEMVVLMQDDIDNQKITAGETRLKVMDECRDLLGLNGR